MCLEMWYTQYIPHLFPSETDDQSWAEGNRSFRQGQIFWKHRLKRFFPRPDRPRSVFLDLVERTISRKPLYDLLLKAWFPACFTHTLQFLHTKSYGNPWLSGSEIGNDLLLWRIFSWIFHSYAAICRLDLLDASVDCEITCNHRQSYPNGQTNLLREILHWSQFQIKCSIKCIM